ncbi:elongation factor G [Fibrobacterales bacterium]|nr:elongation factor G [Fibrobacterales bacterium]
MGEAQTAPPLMQHRNIAILAHIDAGKTTLSERILLTSGEILRAGDVEDGLATLDYLPEEKEKGITIEAGISHFTWRGIWWNIIDAPGHIDFGMEADSALKAADGVVLVISAVDGIQPQTISAWEKIRNLNKPCIIFFNKCDLPDAKLDESFLEIEEQFGVSPVLLSLPVPLLHCNGIYDILSGSFLALNENGKEEIAECISTTETQNFRREACEAASLADDLILEKLLAKKEILPAELLLGLQKLFKNGKHIFCYSGSAKKNIGVRSLLNGLAFFIESNYCKDVLSFSGLTGESKIALFGYPCRSTSMTTGQIICCRSFPKIGEVAIFKSFCNAALNSEEKNLSFYRINAGTLTPVQEIFAGDIYALKGLPLQNSENHSTYSPLLQMRVECKLPEDWQKISAALKTIKHTDPSIKITENNSDGSWVLHAMGAVQFDFILSRLKREFACEVQASAPQVELREVLTKSLAAVENIYQLGNFSVKVKMSAQVAERAEYNTENEIVKLALEEFCTDGVLGKGSLHNIKFELDKCEFVNDPPPPLIKKAVYDCAKMLVLPSAVETQEPFVKLFVQCPAEFAGTVDKDLLSKKAKIIKNSGDGKKHHFTAIAPLSNFFTYSTDLRSITKGRGSYDFKFEDKWG